MYKLTSTTYILRIEDDANIPNDEGNTDYQDYLTWVGEGNVAIPADVVITPVIANSCTPLQFLDLFTQQEQLSVVTAAKNYPQLQLWYDRLLAAQEVLQDDVRVAEGLDALIAGGLITADRKSVILSGIKGAT